MDLVAENKKLKAQLAEKDEFINELFDKGIKDLERIEVLEKKVNELVAIIQAFTDSKPQKNSSNSNKPPSTDSFRANHRSRRVKSGKKPGGQKGHKGNNLKFSEQPDVTINHIPDSCINCGAVLNAELAVFHAARQVIDIPPPPPPTVTQHNTYSVPCSCGCWTQSLFPQHVNATTQYGPRLRALINYCSVRQYIPFDRITEMLQDCFNVSISKGTIANTLRRSAKLAQQTYLKIKQQVAKAPVVGSDETTLFVNAKRKILWVWQSKKFTYLKVTDSRAAYHIKQEFPNGFPNSVLCSDQYAAQLNTPAKAHQACFAHIDRKLIYLAELQNSTWVKNIRALFYHAIELKKQHGYFKRKSKRIKAIETQLNRLLLRKLHYKTHPDIVKLQQSLKRNRDTLINFLFYQDVPPDNNASEQAIRCTKVKMKVSGGFRALHQQFAVLRSIIDTAIKQQKNIWNTLLDLEKGNQSLFIYS